jgi:WD40 repeat protein
VIPNPATARAAPVRPAKANPAKTKLVKEYKHSSPLIGARFDRSGRFVFAGAQDNTIQRWDLASGKATAFRAHKSWVRALAFDREGKTLFSADWAGSLLAWPVDGDKPAPRWTVKAHQGWVRALAVSPDGKTLASCGNDRMVRLWSVADGKRLAELSGHESHVYNVGFHPDGKHLVSGDLKGVVKVWDLTRKGAVNPMVRQFDAGILHKYDPTFMAVIGGVRSMDFSKDGSLLACAGITDVSNAFAGIGKPVIVLFDWKTGKRDKLLRPKTAFQGAAWGVKFHPDGFVAAVGGGSGGALWFWKPDKGDNFFTLKLPNNARDLDLHPDGLRLAIPFADGAVRVYTMG